MTQNEKDMLWQAALDARKQAYAPYSGFSVGAALLADDGRIFVGCNVENAAYSPTLCAERVALGAAVAAGARRFVGIAVIGGRGDLLADAPPCGVCRQMLSEFSDGGITVLFMENGERTECPLSELLPYSFRL